MQQTAWITNNPSIAKALTAADTAYEQARAAAAGLALTDKVAAYRKAREARDAAYKAAMIA